LLKVSQNLKTLSSTLLMKYQMKISTSMRKWMDLWV
jgi:hypothetical protein